MEKKLYEPAVLSIQDSQNSSPYFWPNFGYSYFYDSNLEKIKNEEKPCLLFTYDEQTKRGQIYVNPAFNYYTEVNLNEVYDVILNKVGEEVNKHPYSLDAPFIFPERDNIDLRDLNAEYFELISNTLEDFVNEKVKENNISIEKCPFPQTLSFISHDEVYQIEISDDGKIIKKDCPEITPVDLSKEESLIKENFEIVQTKNSENVQNYIIENKLSNLDVDDEKYLKLCKKEVGALSKEIFSGENPPSALVFYNKDTEQINIYFSKDLLDKTQNLIAPRDYFPFVILPLYEYQEKIEEINDTIIDIDKNPEKYIKEQQEIMKNEEEIDTLEDFLDDHSRKKIDIKTKEMITYIVSEKNKDYLNDICNYFSKHGTNIDIDLLSDYRSPSVKSVDSLLIFEKESNKMFIALNNDFKEQSNISLNEILPSISEKTGIDFVIFEGSKSDTHVCIEGKNVNGDFEKLTINDYREINLELQTIILEQNKELNKEQTKEIEIKTI